MLSELGPAFMLAPLLLSAGLGATARRLARLLPPATAVRLLSTASVVLALACGFVLSVAGFIALAQLPVVAQLGRWSRHALAVGEPMPLLLGAACGTAMLLLLAAGLRRGARGVWDLVLAATACRRLGPHTGGLVVVADERPDAYALPGLDFGGRMVVSTGMLRVLPAEERRALLAHEAAHLRHRHHLYCQATALGAAANPLLRPLAAAVSEAVERWADEEAATEVGDRAVTARALARASLAHHEARGGRTEPDLSRPVAALAAVGDSTVVLRTRALLGPAPRPRRILTMATASLVLVAVGAAIGAARSTEHRFEIAQAAFSHEHPHDAVTAGSPEHRGG
jgi:Zn-dependent protease with chaperone function